MTDGHDRRDWGNINSWGLSNRGEGGYWFCDTSTMKQDIRPWQGEGESKSPNFCDVIYEWSAILIYVLFYFILGSDPICSWQEHTSPRFWTWGRWQGNTRQGCATSQSVPVWVKHFFRFSKYQLFESSKNQLNEISCTPAYAKSIEQWGSVVLSCVVFHHIWQFCGLKVGISPKLPANKRVTNWFFLEFMIAKCE